MHLILAEQAYTDIRKLESLEESLVTMKDTITPNGICLIELVTSIIG
jgi:hypothetical protein